MVEENQKNIISKDKLLEAGVYFGHRKSMRNPKMIPYIVRTQRGTHIIDIEKTKRAIRFAYDLIKNYTDRGATFIFVGTRKQAKKTIKENALRTNSFYVSERWLGGTFTNSRTIFQRVRRMEQLENLAKNNYEGYTKKEGLLFNRELQKLLRNLQGIRTMRRRPNIMIIADPAHDAIAIKEAKKLGVRTIGIVDTNNDPSSVDVAIPANDDSMKAVTLIITILADAIVSKKGGEQLFAFQNDDKVNLPQDPKRQESQIKRRQSNRWNSNYNQTRDQRNIESIKNKDKEAKPKSNSNNENDK